MDHASSGNGMDHFCRSSATQCILDKIPQRIVRARTRLPKRIKTQQRTVVSKHHAQEDLCYDPPPNRPKLWGRDGFILPNGYLNPLLVSSRFRKYVGPERTIIARSYRYPRCGLRFMPCRWPNWLGSPKYPRVCQKGCVAAMLLSFVLE
jgi:hypothetical protein